MQPIQLTNTPDHCSKVNINRTIFKQAFNRNVKCPWQCGLAFENLFFFSRILSDGDPRLGQLCIHCFRTVLVNTQERAIIVFSGASHA